MSRPRLLDLFCGAGGCAVGYQRAGFDVVGVDNRPQPRYCGDEFVQHDALAYVGEWFNASHDGVAFPFHAVHASPPCQAYSRATAWRGDRSSHPDLIDRVREVIGWYGVPFVIENVQEARRLMRNPVMLCGSMFGLRVRRHRYFELSWNPMVMVPDCQHRSTDHCFDHGGKQTESEYRDAMGCGWMTAHEARQAIPPAYTEFIGRQLLNVLAGRAAK